MKKRLIIINLSVLFLSLLAILIASSFSFLNIFTTDSEKELTNYLNMACSVYEHNSLDELVEITHDTDTGLRVTVIDLSGNVIIDSDSEFVEENHFERGEIQNTGTIVQRYSETINREMIYLAKKLENCYIRVSMPMKPTNDFISKYISISTVLVFAVFALSTIVLVKLNDKSLSPVNKQINELAGLADDSHYDRLSIDEFSVVLSMVKKKINDRIMEAEYNEEKIQSLIKEVAQGIIVIDEKGYISLVNPQAYSILSLDGIDAVGKKYIYLIDNIAVQDKIEQVLKDNVDGSIIVTKDNSYISYQMKFVTSSWLKNGIILTLLDVTKERRLEENKKEFFQNASHELKSPLTCIIGYQQMITEEIIDDLDEIKKTSKKTLSEALRMNSIISDMLNLASLEGKKESSKELLNLKDIVIDVITSLNVKTRDNNITINHNLEDVVLNVNSQEMIELIRNLLDNAVKYNKPNGSIDVILSKKRLIVSDTGIGIAAKDIDRIFERFYRVDQSRSRKTGGTGLGLSIVKHICLNYGFNINVDSQIDAGTTFTIEFDGNNTK